MLDRLLTAVIELDERGCVRMLNAAAEQCFGSSRSRLEGAMLANLHQVPEPLLGSLEATRADGEGRHLRKCNFPGGIYDCHIVPLSSGHTLLELHEMEWEQRRQQLEQREIQTGMLDLLRRNLGHEIRNPLGGIRGAAQMMAAEIDDADMQSLARLVMREVDRIDELMRRFGQPQLQRGMMDIHQVVDEAAELLKLESGGHITFQQDYDPSIPSVLADASALRQVMLNLLLNAFQAGATNIRVRTRIEHGASLLQPGRRSLLRIDFEDNGDGVPESIRPLLFLPMVTARRDGTGLGLALAQQIAAAHDGLLTYKALEQGSRFSLRLPLDNGIGDNGIGESGDG